jgi:cellulose synthase/poly-beta-1,6-N-acetylglucosamine synthase-like glycosyltransferase
VVRERFADESRVLLLAKENGGKAEALNFALRRARGEIVVALDADTIFEPTTISALVRRFHDPRVGAVAGNAKVSNRVNVVTRWQALEYVTSQNLDRRAFARLNCITVVPGAVGAWQRALIERAGDSLPTRSPRIRT